VGTISFSLILHAKSKVAGAAFSNSLVIDSFGN